MRRRYNPGMRRAVPTFVAPPPPMAPDRVRREPAALTLVRRDVQPLPGHPGVLHVSAQVRNDAVWPQAWPVLVLTLSDVDGRAVGSRAFTAGEYLADPPTQPTLRSGQSADIAMDLREPAPGIVAFTFDFR